MNKYRKKVSDMSIEVKTANIGGLNLLPEAKYTSVARCINPEKLTKTQTKLMALYDAVKRRLNYSQLHEQSCIMQNVKEEYSYIDGYMQGLIDGMGLSFTENEDYLTVYNSKSVVLVCEKPKPSANKITLE